MQRKYCQNLYIILKNQKLQIYNQKIIQQKNVNSNRTRSDHKSLLPHILLHLNLVQKLIVHRTKTKNIQYINPQIILLKFKYEQLPQLYFMCGGVQDVYCIFENKDILVVDALNGKIGVKCEMVVNGVNLSKVIYVGLELANLGGLELIQYKLEKFYIQFNEKNKQVQAQLVQLRNQNKDLKEKLTKLEQIKNNGDNGQKVKELGEVCEVLQRKLFGFINQCSKRLQKLQYINQDKTEDEYQFPKSNKQQQKILKSQNFKLSDTNKYANIKIQHQFTALSYGIQDQIITFQPKFTKQIKIYTILLKFNQIVSKSNNDIFGIGICDVQVAKNGDYKFNKDNKQGFYVILRDGCKKTPKDIKNGILTLSLNQIITIKLIYTKQFPVLKIVNQNKNIVEYLEIDPTFNIEKYAFCIIFCREGSSVTHVCQH